MKYLAYGMNSDLNGMSYRCPTATNLGAATLKDYQFKFRLHADIEPCAGSIVHGVLWEISDNDLKELDILEGYPTYYTRFTVQVIHDKQTIDALVYMMTDQTYELIPDSKYLDSCIQGYIDNNLNINQIEEAYKSASLYKL